MASIATRDAYGEALAELGAVNENIVVLEADLSKSTKTSDFKPLYEDELPLKEKVEKVAMEIYGAKDVAFAPAAAKMLKTIEDLGYGNLPVCMAKTQYSLSDDQTKLGRPEGFTLNVREVYVNAGAGFVVVLTGSIMTMPGLPKVPAANNIDVDENGVITGLF